MNFSLPLQENSGHIVMGWSAQLEVTPKCERFTHGFTKDYHLLSLAHARILDYNTWKEHANEANKITVEKRSKLQTLPHLFLANELIKNSHTDLDLDTWKVTYGDDTASSDLLYYAKQYDNILRIISERTPNQKQKKPLIDAPKYSPLYRDYDIYTELEKLSIFGFDESYIFAYPHDSDECSIIPFIALEISEVIRMNLTLEKCSICGEYYVKAMRQRKNHCIKCPFPSKRKRKNLCEDELKKEREKTRHRVRVHRKKKLEEKKKRRADLLRSVM